MVFDLTEMLLASTGKTRFYGIARTAAEIAAALARLDAKVRFCIYSAAHDRFFEVAVERGSDGAVAFGIPYGVRQWRVRSVRAVRRPLRDTGSSVLRAIANARTRRAWSRAGIDLPEIDLTGTTFVTCSSPKVIVEEITTLLRLGANPRMVPLLHDLIPFYDEFEPRKPTFPARFVSDNAVVIGNAERILTNSAFTRDEVVRFAADGRLPPLPSGGVHAVPLVHECPLGDEAPAASPPDVPFLLTVGAMLGRKNLEASLDALAIMRAAGGPVPRLVIAGAHRQKTEDHLNSDARAGIRDLVDMRTSPSQSDLVALYEKAIATVVGSRMEGWGLPAGESLWLGTPAICADVPALREVAGDLGLFFDPDSPDQLARHVTRLMTDEAYAGELRKRIAASRPRLRTWSDVARDLLSAL